MTTPPPDTQPAAETLEQIAIQIVNEQVTEVRFGSEYSDMSSVEVHYLADRQRLVTAILSALRNERERAAKLLEKRRDQYALVDGIEADVTRIICTQLAEAIREGK